MGSVLGEGGTGEDEIRASLMRLLAPVLVSIDADAPWEEYVLDQEHTLEAGGRRRLRVCARVVAPARETTAPGVPSGLGRVLGVVSPVAPAAGLELDEAQDRYRLLVELTPDGFVVHQNGLVVYANPAALTMVRGTAETVIGRPIIEFVAPSERAAMLERIAGLKEPGTSTKPAETRLLRGDGSTHPVESVSVLTRWKGGPANQVIMRDLAPREAAAAALRLQASLVENVSDAIIATDLEQRITSWNPAAARMYGWRADQVLGRPLTEVLGIPPRAARGVKAGKSARTRSRAVHTRADGVGVHVEVATAAIRDEMDEVSGTVLICSDVSEAVSAEQQRRRADERYATAVAALDEGVVLLGSSGVIEACNPAASWILGVDADSIVGQDLLTEFVFLADDGTVLAAEAHPACRTRLTGLPQDRISVGVRREDGPDIWLSISARSLAPAEGSSEHAVVLNFTDVTERREASRRLERETRYDDLTGLANRRLVLEQLTALLRRRPSEHMAVLFIDIDRFKLVNDSLGHEAGDVLLTEIGRRLSERSRAAAVVGRLAGDEFVFVSHKVGDAEDARRLAAELLETISRPVQIRGRELVVSASIGVVLFDSDVHESAEELLRDADAAMYRAKQDGRSRIVSFDKQLRAAAVRRLELQDDLHAALPHGELWAAYQPILSLATGRPTGTEALARWHHPRRGAVDPEEFIPLAEDTGLIVALGQHILSAACHNTADWQRVHGLTGLNVSVNLSTRQFAAPDLLDTITGTLASTGLPPGCLTLEITESVLMANPDAAAVTLAAIKAAGVGLSLDDFGTGYSSLAYLRRFPVDTVKIDRSFMRDVCTDSSDRAIVTSIIQLAHTLNLTVTAEGVETSEQAAFLADLGCDSVQGYLYAKPVPKGDLPRVIDELTQQIGEVRAF
jgi:diguanylate cyclase (GGDEF)-like protein/PAS domain S-box-containing protein